MRTLNRESKYNQYAAHDPNQSPQTKVRILAFFGPLPSPPHRVENIFRASEYLEPCLQLASFGFFKSGYLCIWTLGCKGQNPTDIVKIIKNRDSWEGSQGRTEGRTVETRKALGTYGLP